MGTGRPEGWYQVVHLCGRVIRFRKCSSLFLSRLLPILLIWSKSAQSLVHSSWGKLESQHILTRVSGISLVGPQAHSREAQPLCGMPECRCLLRNYCCLRRSVWDPEWIGALACVKGSCDSHSEPEAPVLMRSGVYEAMGHRTQREPEKSSKLSPCLLADISKAHVTLTRAGPGPGLRPLCPCSLWFMRAGLEGSEQSHLGSLPASLQTGIRFGGAFFVVGF